MKKEALKIDKRLYLILMRWLEDQGWNNLWHFSHTAGSPSARTYGSAPVVPRRLTFKQGDDHDERRSPGEAAGVPKK